MMMLSLLTRRSPSVRRRSSRRPHFEPLDDRCLLSGGTLINSAIDDLGADSNTPLTVAVQPWDDKTVVASRENSSSLMRLNADDTLDTTFGNGGIVTTNFPGGSITIGAILITPDHKIVAAGESNTSGSLIQNFAVLRYNADGSLDTTFGSGGEAFIPVSESGSKASVDGASSVALDPSGKLIIAGSATSTQFDFKTGNYPSAVAMIRLNPNGSLDTTFGSGGKVVGTSAGDYDNTWSALQLLPAGSSNYKIELTGSDNGNVVAQFNQNGSKNTSFSKSGEVNLVDGAGQVAFTPDGSGNFVEAWSTTQGGYVLVRYLASGAPDPSFGTAGKVTGNISSLLPPGTTATSDWISSVTVDGSGRVLVAGELTTSAQPSQGGYDSMLLRFNSSGTPDSSFGTNGLVTSAFTTSPHEIFDAVVIRPDGVIVAVGTVDYSYTDSKGVYHPYHDILVATYTS
jgi:uncharacterized delta-60 repeat protein